MSQREFYKTSTQKASGGNQTSKLILPIKDIDSYLNAEMISTAFSLTSRPNAPLHSPSKAKEAAAAAAVIASFNNISAVGGYGGGET